MVVERDDLVDGVELMSIDPMDFDLLFLMRMDSFATYKSPSDMLSLFKARTTKSLRKRFKFILKLRKLAV